MRGWWCIFAAVVLGLEYHWMDVAHYKQWLQSLGTTDKVEVVHPPAPGLANATMLTLCRNSDVYDMLETVQNYQDRFKYNYDWTFLNDEPFDKDFIFLIGSRFDRGRISFGTIPKPHWEWPDHINRDLAYLRFDDLQGLPYGDSESYRHMCRWYSGFFYQHDLISRYQYYWRVEPDVRLSCDINYDVFKYMGANKLKYGFTLTIFEYQGTIPTLWHTFKQFLKKESIDNLPLLPMVQNDDQYESYNLCHFWNNFEIADLSIFNNPVYGRFFEYLDEVGGFYYERWGDAPIHTLAVVLALQPEELHWFSDVGYMHSPYLQCPQDDKTFLSNRCSCNPDDDFSYGSFSCTPHFIRVKEEALDTSAS